MGNKIKKTSWKSWVLYDVGNSAFVLVVVTAIMPIFFKEFAAAHIESSQSTAYWGFANSTASLVVALLSPLLGVIADYPGKKKMLFSWFLLLGLATTLLFVTVEKGWYIYCLTLFIIARIGWSGANLFYDAFLPDVAEKQEMDAVSSKGYGYGYIGSVVPFLIIIGLILSKGFSDGLPVFEVKVGFVVVTCWWLVFSIPLLKNVKQHYFLSSQKFKYSSLGTSLLKTAREIVTNRKILFFLIGYFFYIDGVTTVISMATAYGRDLGFGITLLITVLLFIQIVAFPFALLFGKLAARFGTRKMLETGIVIYILITVLSFLLGWIQNMNLKVTMFWIVAFLVASSMGGIQALSRSYFARIIPPEKSGEYFGFYNILGKFAAIAGPAVMGLVTIITSDSRWGVLSLVLFFIFGVYFFRKSCSSVGI